MSDQEKPNAEGASGNTEVITNLKAEMDRKFQNLQDTRKNTTELLKQQLTRANPPPKVEVPTAKSFKEKFYEDEDAALFEVKETAKKEMRQEFEASQKRTQKQTQILNDLYMDYPEIGDKAHPLTKLAIEKYEAMDEDERANPLSYKVAVNDAARELDVVPAKKRGRSDVDDYSGGGNGGGSKGGKEKSLPNEMLEFARRVGVDVDDPKVLERLKQRAARTNWLKYDKQNIKKSK
jgi:hypothetical protein